MAIKDTNTANCAATMKAMVGEKVIGAIQDYDGRWLLITQSGYALAVGGPNGAFWVVAPKDVHALIAKRQADLGAWTAEAEALMAVAAVVAGS